MTLRNSLTVPCGLILAAACGLGGSASGPPSLAQPAFSHPTRITNPLYPVGLLGSVVLLGESLRVEVTLLPGTRTVGAVKTLAAQHVAYRDGRLAEVTVGRFAQSDDGAVWQFGDGPPTMIMPAHPRRGQVRRPEHLPGRIFDNTTVAVAAPADAGPAPWPAELPGAALAAHDAAVAGNWTLATAALAKATDAGRRAAAPPLIEPILTASLDTLRAALTARDATAAAHAALDVAQSGLDLQLPHRPIPETDCARFLLHLRRLELYQSAGDTRSALAEVATLEWIRDRFAHTLPPDRRGRLDAALRDLRTGELRAILS